MIGNTFNDSISRCEASSRRPACELRPHTPPPEKVIRADISSLAEISARVPSALFLDAPLLTNVTHYSFTNLASCTE